MHVELSSESIELITACKLFLDKYLNKHDGSVYGINTGFGALHNKLTESFLKSFREYVSFVTEDKIMYKEIEAAVRFLNDGVFREFKS